MERQSEAVALSRAERESRSIVQHSRLYEMDDVGGPPQFHEARSVAAGLCGPRAAARPLREGAGHTGRARPAAASCSPIDGGAVSIRAVRADVPRAGQASFVGASLSDQLVESFVRREEGVANT
jgi:hypothetical protein